MASPREPHDQQSATPAAAESGLVLGYHLPRGRLTVWGYAFIVLVFVAPVLLLGVGLDVLLQWVLGRCLGVWCWFG